MSINRNSVPYKIVLFVKKNRVLNSLRFAPYGQFIRRLYTESHVISNYLN